MNRKLGILLGAGAIAALSLFFHSQRAETQSKAGKLVIGVYAPTVEWSSQERLTYIQGLGKAIATNVGGGQKVDGRSFRNLSALKNAKVDFAIVAAQCVARNAGWKVVASSKIGGSTSRAWGLYSNVGTKISALKSKKLAYVKTGCQDVAFIENAMLESELTKKHFSSLVGKNDLKGAVAEVATLKGAQAVFAPKGSQRGLTKVIDVGSVPTPAFVQINKGVSKAIADKVQRAVIGFGASGAIGGWSGSSNKPYASLRSRMGKRQRKGIFAKPSPERIDSRDVLIEPSTLKDTGVTSLSQHFEKPAVRMETASSK